MSNMKRWVVILPILLGLGAVLALKQNRLAPVQAPLSEQARLVRTLVAPVLEVTPRVRGQGSVKPSRTWDAVAQVKGKIRYRHPKLERGAILEAGTRILQIDPTDYQLAVAQAEADMQAIRAQLQELEARAENTRALLKIEQAALTLNEKEFARRRALIGKGSVSRSDLESQERSLLAQQQSVQAQQNTLNLIPSQQALLEAQLAKAEVTLAGARRNLDNTDLTLPFTGRIAQANATLDQYVREGELLAQSDDLQLAEVETQIAINQISQLIQSERSLNLGRQPGEVTPAGLGISAEVALRERGLSASWPARVARLSDTLDPKTRTVGVIVEVDNPYANVQPGVRPPLVKGLFVEVNLLGQPRPNSLVVPRAALHDQQLYVVGSDNRLQFRPVKVGLLQSEYAVISSGLQPGERVIISDPSPAIEGMLVEPRDDEQALERLRQVAGRQP